MSAGYWAPLDPDSSWDDPNSPDPMDWPDGPARRLALGHRDERDVPGYCTCGTWAGACLVRPRKWSIREAHSWAGPVAAEVQDPFRSGDS